MTNEQTAVMISGYMNRLIDEVTRLMDGDEVSINRNDPRFSFLIGVIEDMEADKGNLVDGIMWTSPSRTPWRK